MSQVTDAEMTAALAATREFALVLLYAGPAYGTSESEPVIWEHGRRNFELRAAGRLRIVCPVLDDTPLCGIALFDGGIAEVTELMAEDPAVRAEILSVEIHPVRSFPGDSLPPA